MAAPADPGLGLAPAAAAGPDKKKPVHTMYARDATLNLPAAELEFDDFRIKHDAEFLPSTLGDRIHLLGQDLVASVISLFGRGGYHDAELVVVQCGATGGEKLAFEFCGRILELAMAATYASNENSRTVAALMLRYALAYEAKTYRSVQEVDALQYALAVPPRKDFFVLDSIELFREQQEPALRKRVKAAYMWNRNHFVGIDGIRGRTPQCAYKYLGGFSGHSGEAKNLTGKEPLPRERVINKWLREMGARSKPASVGAAAEKKRKLDDHKPLRVATSIAMITDLWGTDEADTKEAKTKRTLQSNDALAQYAKETADLDLEHVDFMLITAIGEVEEDNATIFKGMLTNHNWVGAVVVFTPAFRLPLTMKQGVHLAALAFWHWAVATPEVDEQATFAAEEVARDIIDWWHGRPDRLLQEFFAMRFQEEFLVAVMDELQEAVYANEDSDRVAFALFRAAAEAEAKTPMLFVSIEPKQSIVMRADFREYLEARWGKERQENRHVALDVALRQYSPAARAERKVVPEVPYAPAKVGRAPIPAEVLKLIAQMSISGRCAICERSSGTVSCAKCGEGVCKDLCYATHVARQHVAA